MRDRVLEAEAVEDAPAIGEEAERERPLPVAAVNPGAVTVARDDARTVAIAAAGGIVAGAATVVIAKAASRAAPSKRSKRTLLGRQKPREVVASRSFLVDVHLLGR